MADLIYRTTGAWGAGKGGNLTPAEVDGNFYELANRAAAALAITPAEIDTITASGTQLTITLTDARVFTVTVPVAAPYSRVATVAGTTATLGLVDGWSYLRCTNAAGCAVTVPTDAQLNFVIGTEIRLVQIGEDPVTLNDQFADVTLNAPTAADFPLATSGEGTVITIKKVAADTWDVYGDLAGTGGGGGGVISHELYVIPAATGGEWWCDPTEYGSNFVRINNEGALTIVGASSVNANMTFLVRNTATPGTVTLFSFERVIGDAFDLVAFNEFLVETVIIDGYSVARVTALQ
jgi:hypothetical protein